MYICTYKHTYIVCDFFGLDPISVKQISIPMIYKTCRHPMQTGILMIIIFSSSLYNLGRIFLVSLFMIGVLIGVIQEENALSKVEAYKIYKKKVTNKFIPNFWNLYEKDDKFN